VQLFTERQTLSKKWLCRVPSLPSARHSAKSPFAKSFLPRAALDKEALCRVPDIWCSAKALALGKALLSHNGDLIWQAATNLILPDFDWYEF